MLRFMLDTNICIYAIKNRPEAVRAAFNAHEVRKTPSTNLGSAKKGN